MKDGAKGSAMQLLSDIRNSLLGIALMIAGIGSILFSMAIVHDFFLGLGAVLLLCGLLRLLSLCVDGKADTEAAQDAHQPQGAGDGASSVECKTPKED